MQRMSHEHHTSQLGRVQLVLQLVLVYVELQLSLQSLNHGVSASVEHLSVDLSALVRNPSRRSRCLLLQPPHMTA
jgi:hypothetical protein